MSDVAPMTTPDRNTRERNRLRIKRKDKAYLACQRIRRAEQMKAQRRRRRSQGLCKDCESIAFGGYAQCWYHLEYNREWARSR